MKIYGILTRYGDYFEVAAKSTDDAHEEGEEMISSEGQHGDSVHAVQQVTDGFQGIRDDLAEILAS